MAGISGLLMVLSGLQGWGDYAPEFGKANAKSQMEKTNEIMIRDNNMLSLYDIVKEYPVDTKIECPERDSKFGYPGSCTKFVTCTDFQAHVRSCPPGMHFDSSHRFCRLAFDSDCESNRRDSAAPPCGRGEVYSDCGTLCERTCDNFRDSIVCPAQCIRGCFCKSGLVRDFKGKCTPQRDCRNRNFLSLWEEEEEQILDALP